MAKPQSKLKKKPKLKSKKKVVKAPGKKKAKALRPKAPHILINFRANDQERKVLRRLADTFANGNMGAWLRYAGVRFRLPEGKKVPPAKVGPRPWAKAKPVKKK